MKAISVLDDNKTWSMAEGARIILAPDKVFKKYENSEDLTVGVEHLSEQPRVMVLFIADLLSLFKKARKNLDKLPAEVKDAVQQCG